MPFETIRISLSAMQSGNRHVQAGNRTYDLANWKEVQKFLEDIKDGRLDGVIRRDHRQGAAPGLMVRGGKVHLPSGRTYDLTKPGDLAALLRDAKDGKIDGRGVSGAGTVRVECTPAQAKTETTITCDSVEEFRAPSHSDASGPVRYPEKDDVEGWRDFLKKYGYGEFRKAWDAEMVGDKVFEDEQFGKLLQEKQQAWNRLWMLQSTLAANDHRTLATIIGNMKV